MIKITVQESAPSAKMKEEAEKISDLLSSRGFTGRTGREWWPAQTKQSKIVTRLCVTFDRLYLRARELLINNGGIPTPESNEALRGALKAGREALALFDYRDPFERAKPKTGQGQSKRSDDVYVELQRLKEGGGPIEAISAVQQYLLDVNNPNNNADD